MVRLHMAPFLWGLLGLEEMIQTQLSGLVPFIYIYQFKYLFEKLESLFYFIVGVETAAIRFIVAV